MARAPVAVAVLAGLLVGGLGGCTSADDAAPSPTVTTAAGADVVTGLDVPWGIAFLPDERAVVTLRDAAQVVLVGGDGTISSVTGPGADQLADIVEPSGEGGLLGVAVLDSSSQSTDLAFYATTADDN